MNGLMVTTERAAAFNDDNKWFVRHIYRTSKESRRTTAFNECNGQDAAEALAAALNRASTPVTEPTIADVLRLQEEFKSGLLSQEPEDHIMRKALIRAGFVVQVGKLHGT